MYATLHGAFGTWPSGPSIEAGEANNGMRPSGVNEQFNFESENPPESARSVFTLTPASHPSGKVFIPPFFVPPDAIPKGNQSQLWATSTQARSQESLSAQPTRHGERHSTQSAHQDSNMSVQTNDQPATVLSVSEQNFRLDQEGPADPLESRDVDVRPQSPPSAEVEAEKAELWSTESRKAFHEMVTAPGYINRYRLHMKKRERMMQYLQNPDREPMLCDGSRDHQTKYQAAHWTVMDGKLYRKPESGRVARFRRHLDYFEAWDVLTMEHVRSGHLGRDKLRKVLEQNYIGYTLQEIMFVLKECKKCASRGLYAERKDANADINMEDAPELDDTADANGVQPISTAPAAPLVAAKGPYKRQQTSNFMWF